MINRTVLVLVDDEVLLAGNGRFAAGAVDRYVVEALRTLVKRVVVRPYTGVPDFIKMTEEIRPSLVFNLTEHSDGDRRKDSHICALMDLLKIPYTGTGPNGMMLCRDKMLSKLVAAQQGFRVPAFFTAKASEPCQQAQVRRRFRRYPSDVVGGEQTSALETNRGSRPVRMGCGDLRRIHSRAGHHGQHCRGAIDGCQGVCRQKHGTERSPARIVPVQTRQ